MLLPIKYQLLSTGLLLLLAIASTVSVASINSESSQATSHSEISSQTTPHQEERSGNTVSVATVDCESPTDPADTTSNLEPFTQATRQVLLRHLSPDLAEQRRIYREALSEIDKNGLKDKRSYREYRNKLKDYPLFSYLEYQRLQKDIRNTSMNKITLTFPQAEDRHFVKTLQTQRLKLLADRGRWQDFIDYYTVATPTPARQCTRALAHYRLGEKQEALALATELWLTPKSMPKDCDTIFYLLQRQGVIDTDLAWQRYLPAFANGEISLSRYLARFLEGEHAATSEKFQLWYDEPVRIKNNWKSVIATLANLHSIQHTSQKQESSISAENETLITDDLKKELLLQLIKRLSRTDQDAATKIVGKYLHPDKDTGLPAQLQKELRTEASDYIIQRHALKDYNELPAIHEKLGGSDSEKSWEWLLRAHIARADWRNLIKLLPEAPDSIRSKDRWQYWALRARQLDNQLDSEGLVSLEEISAKPNFYGFAASAALSKPETIQPERYQRSPELLAQLLNKTFILRAIEHFAQNELPAARRDWMRAALQLSETQLLEAAYLAADLGWYDQAISTAAQAGAWRHYSLRFPDIYREQFRQQAFRYQQTPQWFYATARQESALSASAQSGAGAIGLMQILPTTARQVAKNLQTAYSRPALENPGYSISLGTAYLNDLYQRYNNRAISSAAYNAGPRRVDKWLKNLRAELPLDAWIETIRYSETRQYVQNVLSFGLIHHELHNKDSEGILWPEFTFIPKNEASVKPYDKQLVSR